MPLCGFNQKMIDALRLFGEGLYVQAEKRAKEDKLSVPEALDQEIDEMDTFLKILGEKDPLKVQAIVGITKIARAMYVGAQGSNNPHQAFNETLENLLAFLIQMDNEYYERLRPSAGPKTALHRLGAWIDQELATVRS